MLKKNKKNKDTVAHCDLVVSVQMSEKTLNIETTTEKEIASIQCISVKKAKEIIALRDANGGKFTESDFKAVKISSGVTKRICQGN